VRVHLNNGSSTVDAQNGHLTFLASANENEGIPAPAQVVVENTPIGSHRPLWNLYASCTSPLPIQTIKLMPHYQHGQDHVKSSSLQGLITTSVFTSKPNLK